VLPSGAKPACYNTGVTGQGGEVQFRRMVAADRPRLLQLLAVLRVPIAGSVSPAAHRALANAALRDPRLIVLLAERDGELVGVALGVLDPRRFWRQLALRNPALIAERIPALIRRRLRKRRAEAQATADPDGLAELLSPATGRHWMESSPQVGHVSLVLLHPKLRGSGVSVPFMQRLLEELQSRGATRADARIARSNLASIRMCHRCGMSIELDGSNVLGTMDLPVRGNA